jgi:DNA-directed RNA polymerase subunit beta
MSQTFIGRKRIRKRFGKIREVADMPNLIEVQKVILQSVPDGG